MIKKVAVNLPPHVKKYFMHEYEGYQTKKGIHEIHVDKHSELGKLLHLISRPITYTQPTSKTVGAGTLSIRYYSHVQAMEVPNDKLILLGQYMDEIFRRSMICEVRGGHEVSGGDYGPLVSDSLNRRGIERDVDVDYQTMRKVYRDYIAKLARKRAKSYE